MPKRMYEPGSERITVTVKPEVMAVLMALQKQHYPGHSIAAIAAQVLEIGAESLRNKSGSVHDKP